MLVGQLLVAVTVGLVTATMSLKAGYSGTGILGYLVLGSNIGLLAGAAGANLSRLVQSRRAKSCARGRRQVEWGSLAFALLGSLMLGWSLTH